MNREDVIRMAEQAGASFYDGAPGNCIIQCGEAVLERFAALVAADERRKHQAEIEHWKAQAAQAEKWRALALCKDPMQRGKVVQEIQREAMEIERDACAKACDDAVLGFGEETDWAQGYVQGIRDVADGIRARGNQ